MLSSMRRRSPRGADTRSRTIGEVRVDFVGRHSELRILGERLAAAETGHPQVVYLEGEAGAGKSTLLSQFPGSLLNAVILQVAGDEAETLLSYGIIDQLQPGMPTEPGTDPMAVGAGLLDLLDRRQADGRVVVLVIDDLQWADRLADPGWTRFVGGDSRVTRSHRSDQDPGAGSAVTARGVPTGCPHSRQRALLPGAAR
jgi:hypothetical protein